MGNKEILDYVRNTPGNTNPSVLKGMLESGSDRDNSSIAIFDVEPQDDDILILSDGVTYEQIYKVAVTDDKPCFIRMKDENDYFRFVSYVDRTPPIVEKNHLLFRNQYLWPNGDNVYLLYNILEINEDETITPIFKRYGPFLIDTDV